MKKINLEDKEDENKGYGIKQYEEEKNEVYSRKQDKEEKNEWYSRKQDKEYENAGYGRKKYKEDKIKRPRRNWNELEENKVENVQYQNG